MDTNFLLEHIPQLEGIEKVKQCANYIKKAKKIAVITGAGMSTDSGIPDFRTKKGLYSKNPVDILSRQHFFSKPKEVYNFLENYIRIINKKKPNEGHYILSSLEKLNKNIFIITQNIDSLHSKSGSNNVIEVHGTLNTATCQKCGKKYNTNEIIRSDGTMNYYCDCNKRGLIKPDCVLFGEDVKHLREIKQIVKECDLLLVLGTSLTVYPVAKLPNYLKAEVPIIIINENNTYLDEDRMSIVFHNNISNTLKQIMEYV